jgi:hypothetical protein
VVVEDDDEEEDPAVHAVWLLEELDVEGSKDGCV